MLCLLFLILCFEASFNVISMEKKKKMNCVKYVHFLEIKNEISLPLLRILCSWISYNVISLKNILLQQNMTAFFRGYCCLE